MPAHINTPDGKPLVLVNVHMSPDLRKQIKMIAVETDRKMPEVVIEALSQYVQAHKPA